MLICWQSEGLLSLRSRSRSFGCHVRRISDRKCLVSDEHKTRRSIWRKPPCWWGAATLTAIAFLGFLVSVSATHAKTQAQQRMLLSALEGHTYERVSYDSRGSVKERERIIVGRLETDSNGVSVPVDIETINDGRADGRYTMRWTCAPEAADMVMDLLIFSGDGPKASKHFVTLGPPIDFPQHPSPSDSLPELTMEMDARKGVAGLLGGHTRISMTNRRVTATSEDSARTSKAYVIRSQVELRKYALGIRVSRAQYESVETFDPEQGLLEHVLKRSDGSYTELRRLGLRNRQDVE